MDRSSLPRELRPFLDDAGVLRQWPARRKVQLMAAALLAGRFESGHEYSELEANSLLMDAHAFGDWALLRRFLVDHRFLERESNGTRYRRHADSDARIAAALGASSGVAGPAGV